jgi:hypothetical protein
MSKQLKKPPMSEAAMGYRNMDRVEMTIRILVCLELLLEISRTEI